MKGYKKIKGEQEKGKNYISKINWKEILKAIGKIIKQKALIGTMNNL